MLFILINQCYSFVCELTEFTVECNAHNACSYFPENNLQLKTVQRLETKTSVFVFVVFGITHDINPSPRMKLLNKRETILSVLAHIILYRKVNSDYFKN